MIRGRSQRGERTANLGPQAVLVIQVPITKLRLAFRMRGRRATFGHASLNIATRHFSRQTHSTNTMLAVIEVGREHSFTAESGPPLPHWVSVPRTRAITPAFWSLVNDPRDPSFSFGSGLEA